MREHEVLRESLKAFFAREDRTYGERFPVYRSAVGQVLDPASVRAARCLLVRILRLEEASTFGAE
jgi:hypothetical protein